MAENSKIEWTDATWNPWQGCSKVSEACANCYMFRDMNLYGKDPSIVRRSAPRTFNLPLRKNRDGTLKIPSGSKVFTCSWSDWFHAAADPWRDEAWEVIRQRPDLIFQIVTKRTERIKECLPSGWGEGWPNVWLIATVENQKWADIRISQLLSVPAAVHGLSMEPLLGPVSLSKFTGVELASPEEREAMREIFPHGLPENSWNAQYSRWLEAENKRGKWVIAGGESGHHARPLHPDWARSLRDQCQAAGVPFFFKQWGEWLPDSQDHGGQCSPQRKHCEIGVDGRPRLPGDLNLKEFGFERFSLAGKKNAGRLLDGREWSEFPVATVLTEGGTRKVIE
ncbi:phage Gp37/Gp68 family protein [Candidatus Kaiserbacteria bacterium]|nr:phage Gp37/Gp68 family protein [Candidatus Kaiserbacteria bacterium]